MKLMLSTKLNKAVSCYKEAVQFSASFVMSMFASFNEICGTAMDFVFFSSVQH